MEHLDTGALGDVLLKEGISGHVVSTFEGNDRCVKDQIRNYVSLLKMV